MNKELIDHVWKHYLPKEFKEELKKEWQTANNEERLPHDAFMRGCYSTMVLLFGIHNLTSDAEGEEMLTVSRKRVQELYKSNSDKIGKLCEVCNADEISKCDARCGILLGLFGAKCLPDEVSEVKRTLSENLSEPKPAEPEEVAVAEHATTTQKPTEPKYHPGQKVCYNGYVYEVEGLVGKNRYAIKGLNYDLDEDMIEPYTELEEEIRKSRISPETGGSWHASMIGSGAATAVFNDSGENRRLTIAAMAMQGILSNPTAMNGPKLIDGDEKILAEWSLKFADALIDECNSPKN